MYRYIGNKTKLMPNIIERIENAIGKQGRVADIMAGTGAVSMELRKRGYKVIASDIMTYSYHHLVVDLILSKSPDFNKLVDSGIIKKDNNPYGRVIEHLNNLDDREGYFYREFSPEGKPLNGSNPRKYFTSSNAKKIDAIRDTINEWKRNDLLSCEEESLLLHTLIMAVNEIANISGTYGYFLSEIKKNARNSLLLKEETFYAENSDGHQVRLGFAEDIAKDISADLCYIDPPYMKRQYAANYHILETIARGDYPEAIGKSGLRDWWDQHSKLCTKTKGLQSFEKIMTDMNCGSFLVSYSEDGLFTLEQLKGCFEKIGKVDIQIIDYSRFRSNRSNLPRDLDEYLIMITR